MTTGLTVGFGLVLGGDPGLPEVWDDGFVGLPEVGLADDDENEDDDNDAGFVIGFEYAVVDPTGNGLCVPVWNVVVTVVEYTSGDVVTCAVGDEYVCENVTLNVGVLEVAVGDVSNEPFCAVTKAGLGLLGSF